jgi:uncharacterized protein YrrD
MIVSFSKLIGAPIFELKTQTKLGFIIDIVIKKSDVSIYGLIAKTSLAPFSRAKTISETDILEISNDGIIVEDEKAISDMTETIRLKEAFDGGLHGVGQKVKTKSGKNIGKVFDYLIRADDLTITKIYLKNLFSERIIPTSAIVEIKGRQITINNDYDLVNVKSNCVEAEMV